MPIKKLELQQHELVLALPFLIEPKSGVDRLLSL
jgi:hypothetical protein